MRIASGLTARRDATNGFALLLGVVLIVLSLPAASAAKEQGDGVSLIYAGRMLDVREGVLKSNVVIRVNDGVVESLTESAPGAVTGDHIDLSQYTVLPGLIDVHTHLCDNSFMGEAFDHWTYPAATFGIVGAVNAGKTLRAGFTTVRDVSAPFYADIALRDAIEAGWIEGPRVLASGPMITMTGGHGTWGNWIGPQHRVATDAHALADGPDEVRKAVRRHVQQGVDVIKIVATGGFGTHGTMPGAASYTVDELRAAVEEARKNGLRTAAHAHGAEGILNAVRAGVDSVEHASMLDKKGIEALRKSGTFLVMDLLAAHFELIEKDADFSDKALGRSNRDEFDAYTALFRAAYDAGVPMAFGTDAGVYPHGRNAEQFMLMAAAGMSNADAIRSATIRAAELLGRGEQLGEIAVGKYADIIAVRGNPLEDVSVLKNVEFVMKNGTVALAP